MSSSEKLTHTPEDAEWPPDSRVWSTPPISTDSPNCELYFPLSNDPCLRGHFADHRLKALNGAFEGSINNGAVVVGESQLAIMAPLIPEKVIIVVDCSLEMIRFMEHYIKTIQQSKNPAEWVQSLSEFNVDINYFQDSIKEQKSAYQEANCKSPLEDPELFFQAKGAIRSKQILLWHLDLSNSEGVLKLSHALNAGRVAITLLNITNTLTYTDVYGCPVANPNSIRKNLGLLPIHPDATILSSEPSNEPEVWRLNTKLLPASAFSNMNP